MNMSDYWKIIDALLDLTEAQKLEVEAYKKLTRLFMDKYLFVDDILANRSSDNETSKEEEGQN